jgi:endonuclease/exonuclease/phosphatase family metal-dependent hydrolase
MSNVTICTFNVENLFVRYKVFGYLPGDKFKRKVLTEKELEEHGGFLPGQLFKNSFKIFDKDDWRKLTAKAIKGYGDGGGGKNFPDIICMQEVDSMDALRLFNEDYLESQYDYAILLDSHDPRRIDVGVLSKLKVEKIKTNMYEPYTGSGKQEYLFSRDCLELNFDTPDDNQLTIFVNHLKSNYVDEKDPAKKKVKEVENNKLRLKQANKVLELVKARFPGKLFKEENFVVLGDFNDGPNSPALVPLLKELGMEDTISRLDSKQRWTHWWEKENSVSQLDYILLSPMLSKNTDVKPYIERRGLSNKRKTTHLGTKNGEKIPFDFQRFPQVSETIEASDHCPVFLKLNI